MEKAGEINSLSLQVEMKCIINGVYCWSYYADFVFREKGSDRLTIEDHKGTPKFMSKEFKIKWKTLIAIYGRNHKMQIHYQNGDIVVMPPIQDLKGYEPVNKEEKKSEDLDFSGICKTRRTGNYVQWSLNRNKVRMRKLKKDKNENTQI